MSAKLREKAVFVMLVVASAGGFYLVLEGVYALARKGRPGVSLGFNFYQEHLTKNPFAGALDDYVVREKQLEEMWTLFEEARVVIGNSPYKKLATDEARVTVDDPDAGRRYKPNLTVRSAHMRSRIFKALDPISYSYIVRNDSALNPETQRFLDRYGLREVTWTTDLNGFRTTLPRIEAEDVVTMIGSSPCVGLFLEDDETLASVLQRRQRDVRFVNACVGMTQVTDHVIMARRLIEMRLGRLHGIIYTLNDKNFTSAETALGVLDEVADLLDRAGAGYRVLVYHHYIYETMPDVARKNPNPGKAFAEKEQIVELAESRGFSVVDTYDMVADYRKAKGSLLAGMALYVDHCHFSREGVRILAERVPKPALAGR
jgi:hypothetical protein